MMTIPSPNFAATGVMKHPINIDVDNTGRILKASDRIAYGEVASKGQFNFMAVLGWRYGESWHLSCGGTVIAPMYILTAAHCMVGKNGITNAPTHVFLGSTGLSPSGDFPEKIDVAEVFVHHQYLGGEVASPYDIAIIKLQNATSYPAVTLASSNPSAGASLTSLGWGLTENSDIPSKILRYTELKVGTFGVSPCLSICPQMPCTIICEVGIPKGSDGYTSACAGDSGGPQMLAGTNTQVGIVSFGPRGCGFGTWGASTSVATLKSWINGIIGATPEPEPSPSPEATSAPSPSPSPSLSPSPNPKPDPKPSPTPARSGCTSLDKKRGEIVRVTYKARACSPGARKAAAEAAALSSGGTSYCIISSKCFRIAGGRIVIKAKIATDVAPSKARWRISKAFSTGSYSDNFEVLLPALVKKYTFQKGTACVFPFGRCVY